MAGGESRLQGARSTKGAEDFYRLSKAMKAAGETGLRKELHKAMREVVKPAIPKVRTAARDRLPRRGGLNELVARKQLRAAVRTGADTVGVRIVSQADPRLNNSGRLAHPVFGRARSTVVQQVPGAVGYFDKTIRDDAPQMRAEVEAVLTDFTKRLAAAAGGGA